MKGLIITNKGIEDIAAKEVKELIKVDSSIGETVVTFDIKKMDDLCLLCYKAQSINKVMYLFDSFRIKKDVIKQLEESIKKADFTQFKKSFALKCHRVGNHDFSSQDIETELGGLIKDKIKKKVNLDSPEIIFYIYINDKDCYFGVDFAGMDLSKRDYKIFTHPNSLKGTIAYSLVRISGFKDKQVILDPFCGSATIPIEAAFFISKQAINYYRKNKLQFTRFIDFDFEKHEKTKKTTAKINAYDIQMRYVKASQKNAKIAGINKLINFSRIEAEWLDTKHKEKSIDKIITQPPSLSKYSDKEIIDKTYNELFYQAKYVLKDNGYIVVISNDNLDDYAKKHGFKLKDKRDVWQGSVKILVWVFVKR
jgi:tRNA (guanine6-N2)-methyltransferase